MLKMKPKLSANRLFLLSYFLQLLSWTATAEKFYVMSSSSTGCPKKPCYTLTDVVQNPSQFFASNTVITFLPGNHQTNIRRNLTVVIKDVRNISLIGSDPTNNDSKSVILCTGSLGFAFVNVSTLKLVNLHFYFCGAYFPSNFTVEENILQSWYFKKYIFKTTFYFLQIYKVIISGVVISNSTGAGLLGINMLGHSTIFKTTFSGNKPNCLLIFLDTSSTSKNSQPTLLNLTTVNSYMTIGMAREYHSYPYYITGLTIILEQTKYNVHVHINNIQTFGKLSFIIENWMCHCSVIQATQITSTGESKVLVTLEAGIDPKLPTCNCSKPAEEEYTVKISKSSFVGTGLQVTAARKDVKDAEYCNARIKLENITVQNRTNHTALRIIGMLSITLQDVRVNHNSFKGMSIDRSYVIICGNFLFSNNFGFRGAVEIHTSETFFYGDVKIIANKAKHWAAILAINSTIKFQQTAELVENKGREGGAIALYDNSRMIAGKQSNVTFQNNHAQTFGGAISAHDSAIVVSTNARMLFLENEGYNGGALALHSTAKVISEPYSSITFERNHAQHYGGAMYIEDPKPQVLLPVYKDRIKCFFQPPRQTISRILSQVSGPFIPRLEFQNNTAQFAGDSLYGGWVELCHYGFINKGKLFQVMFHFKEALSQSSVVSSNPTRVCICDNDIYDCNITHYNVTAYPGQTFQIPAVAVGQMFGTVPFPVHARFIQVNSSSPPQMKSLQRTQNVRRTCTNLIYTIVSSHQVEEMKLTVDRQDKLPAGYFIQGADKTLLILKELHVYIRLRPCPLGFVLYNSSCVCQPQLQQHGINCSIDSQTVNRPSSMWINTTFINGSPDGVLVREDCPFGYCKPESFDLDLEDPDEQCAFFRSGILCGACQQNLSHVFGTDRCKECSSLWVLLLVPAFALAGIALVAVLIVLNFTVSVGTINGLIFYANIVRANQATFFPPSSTNSFPSWFIAWINLDLGIETCFYNGLDSYVKTWLQFIFPLYIWAMVILIILSSKYSKTAARLSGRNAVQVLATLFLLSYAKLLRIMITVFQPTELVYPDNTVRRVWLYDGNVDYLKGKHLPLFIAALLLLLISLPYTVILIFIQRLQHMSRYRVLFWVQKLKPLFDAYTGPYKDKHRYWTGLLLLVRIILFVIFSTNTHGSADINLLAISLTLFILFTYMVLAGRVYKTLSLNVVEYSFFLDLGALVSATFYTTVTGQGQTVVAYTSVGIVFTKFILIVAFHILTKIKSSHCFSDSTTLKNLRCMLSQLSSALRKLQYKWRCAHHNSPQGIRHSSVELRESLLEYRSE